MLGQKNREPRRQVGLLQDGKLSEQERLFTAMSAFLCAHPLPLRAPGSLPSSLDAFSGSEVRHLPLSGVLSKQFPLPGPREPSLVLPVEAAGVPGRGRGEKGQVRRRSWRA